MSQQSLPARLSVVAGQLRAIATMARPRGYHELARSCEVLARSVDATSERVRQLEAERQRLG